MDLPDLKQLGQVIDLCRKKGVDTITIGTLTLKLGPEPERKRKAPASERAEPDVEDPYQNFPGGILTPEQLMFYSAGGMPGEEPWNQNKGEQ